MACEDRAIFQETAHHINRRTTPSIWSLGYLSLIFCTGIAVILVFFYLYLIRPYVFFPADILSWAETNFVGDIIKLRIGARIYTPPEDSNCNVYTPGAQLLTYAISWVIGKDTSIPAWRIIQLSFITCAVLLGTVCCRMLQKLIYNDQQFPFAKTWLVLTFLTLFLAATAPRVNTFAHTLQSEALSLLVSVSSLFALLFYLISPNWKRIVLMGVCPAFAYFTKQNLVCWSILMFVVLVLHDFRNFKHLALFLFVSGVSFLIVVGICYLLWGEAFMFWTFEIMGGARKKIGFSPSAFNLSLPRCLDHTVRAWMEIAIGFVGGILLLQGSGLRKFGSIFLAWILLICFEALISGVNWGPLYHFGPGVVIGAIFLLCALPRFWPYARMMKNKDISVLIYDCGKPFIALAGVLTVFVALHVVPTGDKGKARYWKQQSLSDVYRYVQDIEREFEELPVDQVLLDIGNWIYLRHSVLVKDRAISLADQPPAGIYENMYVMVNRIRTKAYTKIMVRDLHSPFFPYDWYSWKKPSGVRDALLEHYDEVRTIPAVKGKSIGDMQVGPVSVLVPKSNL